MSEREDDNPYGYPGLRSRNDGKESFLNVIPFFYFLLKQKSKVVIQSDEDFMETFPQFVNSKTDDKLYVGVKWFTTLLE